MAIYLSTFLPFLKFFARKKVEASWAGSEAVRGQTSKSTIARKEGASSLPHQAWWQEFVRDPGGTGFWHETYFMRGGMEAIYDDLPVSVGMTRFAPVQQARGAMFSARKRLRLQDEPTVASPVAEDDLYGGDEGLLRQTR